MNCSVQVHILCFSIDTHDVFRLSPDFPCQWVCSYLIIAHLFGNTHHKSTKWNCMFQTNCVVQPIIQWPYLKAEVFIPVPNGCTDILTQLQAACHCLPHLSPRISVRSDWAAATSVFCILNWRQQSNTTTTMISAPFDPSSVYTKGRCYPPSVMSVCNRGSGWQQDMSVN